ncbi:hypothetical protein ACFU7D_13420 [Nocardioides sp. NPDC057577]|uniref:hypothetical protein n=1 Tax=Nocardioides sp. NPDC057577 TaxID=3346171 RepID=UPI00366E92F5
MTPTADELSVTWMPAAADRRRLAVALAITTATNWRMWAVLMATSVVSILVLGLVFGDSWKPVTIISYLVAVAVLVPMLILVPSLMALRRYRPSEPVTAGVIDGEFRVVSSRATVAIPLVRVSGVSTRRGIVTLRTTRPAGMLLIPSQLISAGVYELLSASEASGDASPAQSVIAARDGLREVTVTRALQWHLTFASARLAFRWWSRVLIGLLVAFALLLVWITGDWTAFVRIALPLTLVFPMLVLPRHLATCTTCPAGSVISGAYGPGLTLRTPSNMLSITESDIARRLVTRHAVAFKIGPTIISVPRTFGDR